MYGLMGQQVSSLSVCVLPVHSCSLVYSHDKTAYEGRSSVLCSLCHLKIIVVMVMTITEIVGSVITTKCFTRV